MKLLHLHKNLIPLLLLAIVCLYTIVVILTGQVSIEGESYDRTFSYHHYLAFTAIALNFGVYFWQRRLFRFTLVGMLALGLLNIIHFTPDQVSITLGFSDAVSIRVEPLSLVFIISYYFLNRNRANKPLRKFLRTYVLPSPSPQKQVEARRERVAKFKVSFAKRSEESLLEMVRNRNVVPDALEAAKQILHERGVTSQIDLTDAKTQA
jgi:hypothetical protein